MFTCQKNFRTSLLSY